MIDNINKDFMRNLVYVTGAKSQEALAREMHVGRSTVVRWIHGDMLTKYILGIAVKYGINVFRFLMIDHVEMGSDEKVVYKCIRLRSSDMVKKAMKELDMKFNKEFMERFGIKRDVFRKLMDDSQATELHPELFLRICDEANLSIYEFLEIETVGKVEDDRLYTLAEIEGVILKRVRELLDSYADKFGDRKTRDSFVHVVVDDVHVILNMAHNMI